MISLVSKLPEITEPNAEYFKIKALFDMYAGDALFWRQSGGNFISLSDGHMNIFAENSDTAELHEFVGMLSPESVFGDYETLCAIDRRPNERVTVMLCSETVTSEIRSDSLSSREIYELLSAGGLELPEYPFFAVDFCRRLNHGGALYFAVGGKCAAVSFNTGAFALINGIASREKGFGSKALKGIISANRGRKILVCCREELEGFYLKNGFEKLYYAGYWVKNK